MDSLIAAAARALAGGDAIGALKRVALREDPPGLALRGIAMAQLGDLVRARELLQRAARGFGPHEARARARCAVAEAEVALAMRDLDRPTRGLAEAAAALDAQGDHANAAQARLITARRLVLLGKLDDARAELAGLDNLPMPPALTAIAALAAAELALRSLCTGPARAALALARAAAARAGVPALVAEVDAGERVLEQPAARQIVGEGQRLLRLDEVETLFDSGALVVDGCRLRLRIGAASLALARRPVLFSLVRELATAWPGDIDRDALIASAFRAWHIDDTHRARLRVEIGRLRALVKPWARIDATARGFALTPYEGRDVAVLAPPIDGEQASLLALLADGEAWSTPALALALGTSQRTVQRALAGLEAAGKARTIGRTRARRWLAAPLAGFTTTLLLPVSLPPG